MTLKWLIRNFRWVASNYVKILFRRKEMNPQLYVVLRKPIRECTEFLKILKDITGDDYAGYVFKSYELDDKTIEKAAVRNREFDQDGLNSGLDRYKNIVVRNCSVNDAITLLKLCPDVESVNKRSVIEPLYQGNDPYWSDLWHLHANSPYGLQVEKVWDSDPTLGEGMVVATIEPYYEACRYTHEDFGSSGNEDAEWQRIISQEHPSLLASKFNGEWDKPTSSYGHATMTASVLCSKINNGKGHCGVIPKGKVMNVYFGHDGPTYDTIEDAIIRAASQGADVISLSLTGCTDDPAINAAIQYALNLGVPVVWALGPNSDFSVITNPAPNAINVSSTDKDGIARYSYLMRELTAPGIDVFRSSAIAENGGGENNSYRLGSGNSLATPLVAGVVALMLKKHPDWTLGDIRQALHDGIVRGNPIKHPIDEFGNPLWHKYYGYGCVNAFNSINLTLDDLGVLPPMCLTSTGSYKRKFYWHNYVKQTRYSHTLLVKTPSSFGPAKTPSDGEIIYSGEGALISDGRFMSSEIWIKNGTWYITAFNVDTTGKTSKNYGDYFDTRMDGRTSYYKIIVSSYVKPVADFLATPLTGEAPFTVSFDDQPLGSRDASMYLWDFGDGVTSTERNPTHTYTKPGLYTVKYTCGNPLEQDTKTCENLIKVTGVMTVDFTPNSDIEIPVNTTVTAINLSTGGESYYWHLNGEIQPSLPNNGFEYTFNDIGIYELKLIGYTHNMTLTDSKAIIIKVIPTVQHIVSEVEKSVTNLNNFLLKCKSLL
jgi:PKD repeat protein/subtilisin family serine protease